MCATETGLACCHEKALYGDLIEVGITNLLFSDYLLIPNPDKYCHIENFISCLQKLIFFFKLASSMMYLHCQNTYTVKSIMLRFKTIATFRKLDFGSIKCTREFYYGCLCVLRPHCFHFHSFIGSFFVMCKLNHLLLNFQCFCFD